MSRSFFVTTRWLAEHLDDEHVLAIDACMLPPGQETVRDITTEYLSGHLPDAPFFNIESLSDNTSPYPHMMPRPETFAVAMREQGISSDQHLVVYDEGNLFSAPRAWWMLRTFGVARVSILAGGLQAWKQANLPLATGPVSLPEAEFDVRYDASQIVRVTDVLLASHEKTSQIIDARSAERFCGKEPEPRPGLRRGHIPGSQNVPWNTLVAHGELKPADELQAIFRQQGVDLNMPAIVSCGSGVTAAVLMLALNTLGRDRVTLYDGAWGEWGSRSDLPITTDQ